MNPRGRARVLVVDDEPTSRRSLARALIHDFEVLTVEDGAAALGLLATTQVEAMLLDLGMPRMDGAAVLDAVRASYPDVEVVVMASHDEADAALAAVRAGAHGFLMKPIDPEAAAAVAIERAIERRRLSARAQAAESRLSQHEQLGEIVTASSRMHDAYKRALGVAALDAPVLLVGEGGTGKELVARAIHRRSPRAGERLVALDCSAVPAARASIELFGGGGTTGVFEAASAGTVFLDDVDALPPDAQAGVLQAISRGELSRSAGEGPRRADVRVVAATRVDLRRRVAEGRFREDLYYRLGVIFIELPPLRQRKEDIPLLANHFLHRSARRHGREVRRIGTEAMRLLRDHPWPGNVTELESAIEHAVLTSRGDAIMPSDLPATLSKRRPPDPPDAPGSVVLAADLCELPYAEAKERAIEAFDKAYVARLIGRTDGNLSEAARRAGMDRSNFRRLKKKVEAKDDLDAHDEEQDDG